MKAELTEKLKKIMNTKRLVIICMIGIGLLLLPDLFVSKKQEAAPLIAESTSQNHSVYEKELEARLSSILSTIRGVSQVSVMITLEDGGETYYARNLKSDAKNTADGSLTEDSNQTDGSLALKNEAGGGQSPILLKSQTPKISGVLVTAKGVGIPSVQADVISAVRAVLDVPIHRVEVLEKA